MNATNLTAALRGHPLLARVAPHLDGSVAVVGGAVRDALLGRPHLHDLDLVVEGDALPVAARVAHALGVRAVMHGRFGTAALEMPHGEGHVDLITARRERYPAPGALPEVEPGSLADDLARRDFSVNAMAVWVSGPREGVLEDPHGGAADLAAGVIRSLRDDAFPEDPSRVVRAARYAGRLGFALAPATRAAAAREAPRLDWAAFRVAEELRRLLEEPEPAPGVAILRELGAPGLRPGAHEALADLAAALRADGAPEPPVWALRLGAVLDPAALGVVALPGWAAALGRELQAGAALAGRLRDAPAPSAVDALLRDVPPATALGALAAGAAQVEGWWRTARGLELAVDGADLVSAGVAPGPAIGRALAAVRAAVLDGEVDGRDGQLALALRVARDGA
ncbi:MAG: CCA tRNA nucleotidyltransferase [Thermoleophilia bacterium]|nr:CCA tRNA nucleotidyltransferase [Thermoleophilia bacterium]